MLFIHFIYSFYFLKWVLEHVKLYSWFAFIFLDQWSIP